MSDKDVGELMSGENEPDDRRGSLDHSDWGRRAYARLEKKMDEHDEEVKARFHRWFTRGLIAFSVIAVSSALALFGFYFVLKAERNRAVELCETTNVRHGLTVKALKNGSDQDIKNAPTLAAKEEIARRRDVTIALIDALAPYTPDCKHPVVLKPPPEKAK